MPSLRKTEGIKASTVLACMVKGGVIPPLTAALQAKAPTFNGAARAMIAAAGIGDWLPAEDVERLAGSLEAISEELFGSVIMPKAYVAAYVLEARISGLSNLLAHVTALREPELAIA